MKQFNKIEQSQEKTHRKNNAEEYQESKTISWGIIQVSTAKSDDDCKTQ
jgi:hypothetical protein